MKTSNNKLDNTTYDHIQEIKLLYFIKSEEGKLYLKEPLILNFLKNSDNIYIIECPYLDIHVYNEEHKNNNILIIQSIKNKLINEMYEHIYNLYINYRYEDDKCLNKGAKEMKNKYLSCLTSKEHEAHDPQGENEIKLKGSLLTSDENTLSSPKVFEKFSNTYYNKETAKSEADFELLGGGNYGLYIYKEGVDDGKRVNKNTKQEDYLVGGKPINNIGLKSKYFNTHTSYLKKPEDNDLYSNDYERATSIPELAQAS